MDLNKIKKLGKEELLKKLKQGGFKQVAIILEDKDVDGDTFIGLNEIQLQFRWKLDGPRKEIHFGVRRSSQGETIATAGGTETQTRGKTINKGGIGTLTSDEM
ncbi:hypothetical protein NQ318_010678 [Aromia moschata]|uniref:Uncharacterized protein n=1 Tax=Aromia moschata TaxID=1265417 RepID=A0AAV8X3E1_9CUCU|nr:hypothetical protein NQ318_010678 [Aromia moschata]